MAEELALDLDELRRFQSLAKRPKVLSILSSEIQKLEKVYVCLLHIINWLFAFLYYFFMLDYVVEAESIMGSISFFN